MTRQSEAAMTQHRVATIADRLRRVDAVKTAIVALRRSRIWLMDRWLNIDTIRPVDDSARPASRLGDAYCYESVDYGLLSLHIRRLRPGADEVLVDIGCGLGRPLCLFARQRLHGCIGIECDRELAEVARRNARSLRGRKSPVEIWTGDAVEADYSQGTLFWLFNPFGAETLRTVLARIEATLMEHPRQIRVVYLNPVHEEVLASSGWLFLTERVRSPLFQCEASYWSNVDDKGLPGCTLTRPAPSRDD